MAVKNKKPYLLPNLDKIKKQLGIAELEQIVQYYKRQRHAYQQQMSKFKKNGLYEYLDDSYIIDSFPTLKQVRNDTNLLVRAMSRLSAIQAGKGYTIAYVRERKQYVEEIADEFVDSVEWDGNIKTMPIEDKKVFIQFLNAVRKAGEESLYPSEQVLQWWREGNYKEGMSFTDIRNSYRQWWSNQQQMLSKGTWKNEYKRQKDYRSYYEGDEE